MTIAKTSVSVLTSQSVAAGSSKTSPAVTSSTINCTSYYGAEIGWTITNGSSAPGSALGLTFQQSTDGSTWHDYYTIGGDTVASSINSGSIKLDRDVMYLRAIAYGNTTNAVTVEVDLSATTSL